MSDQDTDNQLPTGQDKDREISGQQREDGQPTFGQPETGEAHEGEALTETDQETGDEFKTQSSETTGENEGGFIASKDEDSGDYLQEKDEQSDKTDIEGSSTFGTNGE
jgi:hypothetical protein